MNKKLIIGAAIAVVVVIVAAIAYFVVLPILADEPEVAGVLDETGTEPVESEYLIPEDIGESQELDLLPSTMQDDPMLGSELAVDLDSLTDDQRNRIMAGELTMEQLAAELESAPLDGSTDPIGKINFGSPDATVIDTNPTSDSVTFGDPDVQFGEDYEEVNIPPENSNNEVLTLKNLEEPAEDLPVVIPEVKPETEDAELEKAFDVTNTVPITAIAMLLFAYLVKVLFLRRIRV